MNWKPPWTKGPLREWAIVGMNHYHVTTPGPGPKQSERRLFVAMTKGGHCITEEGEDDEYVWNRLCHKAWGIEEAEARKKEANGHDQDQ